MNKQELVNAIATKTELSKKDSEVVLKAVLDSITEELVNGGEVNISGFGKFSVVEVAERTGIVQLGDNKGSTYTTPAHVKPAFKFGKAVKDLVKGI